MVVFLFFDDSSVFSLDKIKMSPTHMRACVSFNIWFLFLSFCVPSSVYDGDSS